MLDAMTVVSGLERRIRARQVRGRRASTTADHHYREGDYEERQDVQEVEDERVRERLRVGHAVGRQDDDRRALEDPERRWGGGQDHGEADPDHDEYSCERRQPEVAGLHHAPEPDTEHDPRERRPGEADDGDPGAQEPGQPTDEVRRCAVDALVRHEGEPLQRPDEEPDRAIAEDEHDRRDDGESEEEREPDETGALEPGHLRQPGEHDEEQEDQREDVLRPRHEHRRRSLGQWGRRALVERDDRDGISCPDGQDRIREVADELGPHDRAERRSRGTREERLPAHGTDEKGENEQRQSGDEPRIVRRSQCIERLLEIRIADGDVREDALTSRPATMSSVRIADTRRSRNPFTPSTPLHRLSRSPGTYLTALKPVFTSDFAARSERGRWRAQDDATSGATSKFENWIAFFTKGAEKRKQRGSKGAHVFRDPNDENRVWTIYDWDEEGWQSFISDPEVAAIFQEGGLQSRPQAAELAPRARRLARTPNRTQEAPGCGQIRGRVRARHAAAVGRERGHSCGALFARELPGSVPRRRTSRDFRQKRDARS